MMPSDMQKPMDMRVIRKRVSVRNFSDKPISDGAINDMLEAARLVPTPGNGQGHIIGVIKDQELKTKLAQAAGGQMRIATAPVVFALCGDIPECENISLLCHVVGKCFLHPV